MPSQDHREKIERDHGDEKQVIAGQHAEVFEHSADHDPEKVRSECHIGQLRLTKRIRENHVRQKDRREDETARDHIAGDRVLKEQRFRPDYEV